MKKIWMRKLAENEAEMGRTREQVSDRGPLRSRQSEEPEMRKLDMRSKEADHVVKEIYKSNFDVEFSDRYWKIETIELVQNERLHKNYDSFKDELNALGRKKEDLDDVFVFSAETEKACREICREGHKIGLKKRHVLGYTGSGVHLVRNYDILTRYVTYQQFTSPSHIMVYKAFLGKAKPIVPRLHKDDNYVAPWSGFDCHVSARKIEPEMPICEALNCSYVYFYEYDDIASNTVKYPRQILPHAVLQITRKYTIGTEIPFLAVGRHNKISQVEVKGETRRGFRFTYPQQPTRKTKQNKVLHKDTRTLIKEQLLEMRTKGDGKSVPPALKKNEPHIPEDNAKSDCDKQVPPPRLSKCDKIIVKFNGQRYCVSPTTKVTKLIFTPFTPNTGGDMVKTNNKEDVDKDKDKNKFKKLNISRLPKTLKPFVPLKRLQMDDKFSVTCYDNSTGTNKELRSQKPKRSRRRKNVTSTPDEPNDNRRKRSVANSETKIATKKILRDGMNTRGVNMDTLESVSRSNECVTVQKSSTDVVLSIPSERKGTAIDTIGLLSTVKKMQSNVNHRDYGLGGEDNTDYESHLGSLGLKSRSHEKQISEYLHENVRTDYTHKVKQIYEETNRNKVPQNPQSSTTEQGKESEFVHKTVVKKDNGINGRSNGTTGAQEKESEFVDKTVVKKDNGINGRRNGTTGAQGKESEFVDKTVVKKDNGINGRRNGTTGASIASSKQTVPSIRVMALAETGGYVIRDTQMPNKFETNLSASHVSKSVQQQEAIVQRSTLSCSQEKTVLCNNGNAKEGNKLLKPNREFDSRPRLDNPAGLTSKQCLDTQRMPNTRTAIENSRPSTIKDLFKQPLHNHLVEKMKTNEIRKDNVSNGFNQPAHSNVTKTGSPPAGIIAPPQLNFSPKVASANIPNPKLFDRTQTSRTNIPTSPDLTCQTQDTWNKHVHANNHVLPTADDKMPYANHNVRKGLHTSTESLQWVTERSKESKADSVTVPAVSQYYLTNPAHNSKPNNVPTYSSGRQGVCNPNDPRNSKTIPKTVPFHMPPHPCQQRFQNIPASVFQFEDDLSSDMNVRKIYTPVRRTKTYSTANSIEQPQKSDSYYTAIPEKQPICTRDPRLAKRIAADSKPKPLRSQDIAIGKVSGEIVKALVSSPKQIKIDYPLKDSTIERLTGKSTKHPSADRHESNRTVNIKKGALTDSQTSEEMQNVSRGCLMDNQTGKHTYDSPVRMKNPIHSQGKGFQVKVTYKSPFTYVEVKSSTGTANKTNPGKDLNIAKTKSIDSTGQLAYTPTTGEIGDVASKEKTNNPDNDHKDMPTCKENLITSKRMKGVEDVNITHKNSPTTVEVKDSAFNENTKIQGKDPKDSSIDKTKSIDPTGQVACTSTDGGIASVTSKDKTYEPDNDIKDSPTCKEISISSKRQKTVEDVQITNKSSSLKVQVNDSTCNENTKMPGKDPKDSSIDKTKSIDPTGQVACTSTYGGKASVTSKDKTYEPDNDIKDSPTCKEISISSKRQKTVEDVQITNKCSSLKVQVNDSTCNENTKMPGKCHNDSSITKTKPIDSTGHLACTPTTGGVADVTSKEKTNEPDNDIKDPPTCKETSITFKRNPTVENPMATFPTPPDIGRKKDMRQLSPLATDHENSTGEQRSKASQKTDKPGTVIVLKDIDQEKIPESATQESSYSSCGKTRLDKHHENQTGANETTVKSATSDKIPGCTSVESTPKDMPVTQSMVLEGGKAKSNLTIDANTAERLQRVLRKHISEVTKCTLSKQSKPNNEFNSKLPKIESPLIPDINAHYSQNTEINTERTKAPTENNKKGVCKADMSPSSKSVETINVVSSTAIPKNKSDNVTIQQFDNDSQDTVIGGIRISPERYELLNETLKSVLKEQVKSTTLLDSSKVTQNDNNKDILLNKPLLSDSKSESIVNLPIETGMERIEDGIKSTQAPEVKTEVDNIDVCTENESAWPKHEKQIGNLSEMEPQIVIKKETPSLVEHPGIKQEVTIENQCNGSSNSSANECRSTYPEDNFEEPPDITQNHCSKIFGQIHRIRTIYPENRRQRSPHACKSAILDTLQELSQMLQVLDENDISPNDAIDDSRSDQLASAPSLMSVSTCKAPQMEIKDRVLVKEPEHAGLIELHEIKKEPESEQSLTYGSNLSETKQSNTDQNTTLNVVTSIKQEPMESANNDYPSVPYNAHKSNVCREQLFENTTHEPRESQANVSENEKVTLTNDSTTMKRDDSDESYTITRPCGHIRDYDKSQTNESAQHGQIYSSSKQSDTNQNVKPNSPFSKNIEIKQTIASPKPAFLLKPKANQSLSPKTKAGMLNKGMKDRKNIFDTKLGIQRMRAKLSRPLIVQVTANTTPTTQKPFEPTQHIPQTTKPDIQNLTTNNTNRVNGVAIQSPNVGSMDKEKIEDKLIKMASMSSVNPVGCTDETQKRDPKTTTKTPDDKGKSVPPTKEAHKTMSGQKSDKAKKSVIIPFNEVMRKKKEQFFKFRHGLSDKKFIDFDEFKQELQTGNKCQDIDIQGETGFPSGRHGFNKFNPKYMHKYPFYNRTSGPKGNMATWRKPVISQRGTKLYEDSSDSDDQANDNENGKTETQTIVQTSTTASKESPNPKPVERNNDSPPGHRDTYDKGHFAINEFNPTDRPPFLHHKRGGPFYARGNFRKFPFGRGQNGFFSWRRKYQGPVKTFGFGERIYVTRRGVLQTEEEHIEWKMFKEREKIRVKIEESIRDYKRTFEQTGGNFVGDEKVSKYLQTLTEKLDILQNKRNPVTNPVENRKRNNDIPDEVSNLPKPKEDLVEAQRLISVDKFRDTYEQSFNANRYRKQDNNLVDELCPEPDERLKQSEMIETMLREHVTKHLETVTERLKLELTAKLAGSVTGRDMDDGNRSTGSDSRDRERVSKIVEKELQNVRHNIQSDDQMANRRSNDRNDRSTSGDREPRERFNSNYRRSSTEKYSSRSKSPEPYFANSSNRYQRGYSSSGSTERYNRRNSSPRQYERSDENERNHSISNSRSRSRSVSPKGKGRGEYRHKWNTDRRRYYDGRGTNKRLSKSRSRSPSVERTRRRSRSPDYKSSKGHYRKTSGYDSFHHSRHGKYSRSRSRSPERYGGQRKYRHHRYDRDRSDHRRSRSRSQERFDNGKNVRNRRNENDHKGHSRSRSRSHDRDDFYKGFRKSSYDNDSYDKDYAAKDRNTGGLEDNATSTDANDSRYDDAFNECYTSAVRSKWDDPCENDKSDNRQLTAGLERAPFDDSIRPACELENQDVSLDRYSDKPKQHDIYKDQDCVDLTRFEDEDRGFAKESTDKFANDFEHGRSEYDYKRNDSSYRGSYNRKYNNGTDKRFNTYNKYNYDNKFRYKPYFSRGRRPFTKGRYNDRYDDRYHTSKGNSKYSNDYHNDKWKPESSRGQSHRDDDLYNDNDNPKESTRETKKTNMSDTRKGTADVYVPATKKGPDNETSNESKKGPAVKALTTSSLKSIQSAYSNTPDTSDSDNKTLSPKPIPTICRR